MLNRPTVSLGALVLLAMTPALAAQTSDATERFTFVVANAPESTVDGDGPFQLTVHRWSTDAERDRLHATIKESGSEKLLDAFRDVGAVGYLRWPGGLEYTLRYARRVAEADGRTDIVLVADHPVWVWWDSDESEAARSSDTRYTVVQIRLDDKGMGEGRLSLSTTIAADERMGVTLSDYEGQPVLMTNVQRAEAPRTE